MARASMAGTLGTEAVTATLRRLGRAQSGRSLRPGERDRQQPGHPGVVDDEGRVRPDRGAVREHGDPGQQPGCQRRARDAGVGSLREGALDR
jgi:hypothetical protein